MKYSRNSNFCGKCALLLNGEMVAHNIESDLADSIVGALNNYEALKEALIFQVDEWEQLRRSYKQLSGDDIEEPERITIAKKALQNK
jgi:hypothetical protein